MKRADHTRRLNEIVNRLSELSEQDGAIVQPRQLRANEPVPELTMQQLEQYGRNYDERTRLHEELRKLAVEKIGD